MNTSNNKNTKLACVIIAAGSSSRLGQPKQLVKLKGQTLLYKIAQHATELTDQVTCVFGFEADALSTEISHLNIKKVVNENWYLGMGSSIAAGVNSLNSDIDGVMILLCDQWAISSSDLKTIKSHWETEPTKIAAAKYYDHKLTKNVIGAPAIFPRSFFDELTALRNTGARKLLMRHEKALIKVEMNNAAFDLDTPEDFECFHQHDNFNQANKNKPLQNNYQSIEG